MHIKQKIYVIFQEIARAKIQQMHPEFSSQACGTPEPTRVSEIDSIIPKHMHQMHRPQMNTLGDLESINVSNINSIEFEIY